MPNIASMAGSMYTGMLRIPEDPLDPWKINMARKYGNSSAPPVRPKWTPLGRPALHNAYSNVHCPETEQHREKGHT